MEGNRFPARAFSAFTLVELLLVVGLLALLIGLLLPALSKARRSGNRIICMNNLRQLGVGSAIYTNLSHGVLPWDGYGEGDRPARPVGFWDDSAFWVNATTRYGGGRTYNELQDLDSAGRQSLAHAGDQGILICPEAESASPGPTGDVVLDGYFLLWGWEPSSAPAMIPVQRKTFWCFGFNTQLDGGVEDRKVGYRVTVNVTSIKSPATTALIIEKIMRPQECSPPFASSVGQAEVSWREFTTRHDGGGFTLFVDGHVGFLSRASVISPPGLPFDYNQPARIVWNPFGVAN